MAEPPDNKVARPEASSREQFDDKTRSGDLGSGQAELFFSSACLPASINVGPFGVAEWWLASVLQLPVELLHGWHNDVLGAPRDYTFRRTGYFYTATGVRAIVEQLGQADKIQVIEHQVPPAPPRPTIAPGAQRSATGVNQGGFVHRAAARLEAKEAADA